MKDKETRDPSREQLAFPEFKTRDGESAKETNKRMNDFVEEILEKYEGKRRRIKYNITFFIEINI